MRTSRNAATVTTEAGKKVSLFIERKKKRGARKGRIVSIAGVKLDAPLLLRDSDTIYAVIETGGPLDPGEVIEWEE